MINLERVRTAINRDKRILSINGTPYRKSTVVYASRLMNNLVSSKNGTIKV